MRIHTCTYVNKSFLPYELSKPVEMDRNMRNKTLRGLTIPHLILASNHSTDGFLFASEFAAGKGRSCGKR